LDTAADLTDHLGAELDDVVLPHHDTHHGRDGVVNGVFGPTFASFDEFALRIDRIHDAGGVVVFEGRVTGLTKADGKPNAPAAWLWTVPDGRIVIYHNNDLE
jgi:ketosteroid isomerase-like protein